MGRLIDADELKKKINTAFWSEIGKLIDDAPTIEVPKWIPCSERLPKINHNVLLSTTNGEVFVGYRDKPDLIWQVTEKGDKHWVYDPEAYTDDIDSLVIDCKSLEYISSSGIRQFVAAHKQMNGKLTLTNVSPEILDILNMTGISKRIQIK